MKNRSDEEKLILKPAVISPYIYQIPSLSSISIKMLVLLLLQVVMLFITKSYDSVFVFLVALLGALFAAVINYFTIKEPVYSSLTIFIQGSMIGLLLPQNYPLIAVFSISFLSLFISRCIIYQSINNWINVTAVAIIIAWVIGRNFFPPFSITSDLISLRNPSVYLIQNGTFPVYEFDSSITSFLNNVIFNHFSVTVPDGFMSILWDSKSIIPAFRFNFLIIISSVVLFCDNSYSGIIPSIFLIVYAVLVRVFAPVLFGGSINQGDILLAIFSGGTLFCAVFMIQWFGTIPVTVSGKVCLGIFSGIVAFLIMGCGTSPVGMVYTVLICNIFNMMIRVIEEKQNKLGAMKVVEKLAKAGEQK